MKSKFLVLFICLLATVAMVGCGGSGSSSDVVGTSYGNLIVKVVEADDNITTVAGPSFKVAKSSAIPALQDDGTYLLSSIAIGEKISLEVEKTAYLTAYALVNISTNNTTVVQVAMIKNSDLDASDVGIDLSVTDPAAATFATSSVSIKFKQNSVKNGNTIVKTPEVKIAYKAPPITADAIAVFPGNFEGIEIGGTTPVPFETYGFIYVDLGAGNELTETASLTMPTTAAAPATMPVWSYDEGTGIWTQTGTADKKELPAVGSGKWYYEAAVDHFSWYNLDAPITEFSRIDVIVASYAATIDNEGTGDTTDTTDDPNKTDLTKRLAGVSVVLTTTLEPADGDDFWAVNADFNSSTFTRTETKLTNSQGIVSFEIPAGRRISIKATSSGGESASGYSYEVVDSVATAFINMSSPHMHGGNFK